MSSRRSKFEIYVDILSQIKKGINKPTRIMYGVNLSWKPLQEILQKLANQGLIEENSTETGDNRTKTIYMITDKGEVFLQNLSQVKKLMELEATPSL